MRRWMVFLLAGWLLGFVGGSIEAADNQQLVDSLLHRADSLPMGAERLEVMRRLVRATQMNPKGIDYTRRLLREAELLHHDSLMAYSATLVANHFFARKDRSIDSLEYWTSYGLPIAKRCHYWNMYFLLHKTRVQTYLYAEHYEYALQAAEEMLREAKTVGDADGQLIAYSCLANSYQSTKRWKETREALMEAYRLFDQRLQTANKITILKQILYYLDVVHRCDEMKPYLELMEQNLHYLLKTHPLMGNALNDYFMMLECFYVQYFSHSGEKKLAEGHIRKAQDYMKRLNFESYYLIYANALSTYYVLCGDYDRALALNDSALLRSSRGGKGSRYIYYLEQRAGINFARGDYEQALAIYQEAKMGIDSLSQLISDAQLEEIRELYRLDELQMEREAKGKKILSVVLLLLGLMLIVVLLSLLHRGFVQRRLRKSEQKLKQAMAVTQQANDDKHRFLATMSHAIRVPLDAVVGFSQILASDETLSEEERQEYGQIVQDDTEKLLFLVNSILDLSRLEAGMTKWKLTDGDMLQVCRDALHSVKLAHPDMQIEAEIPEGIFMVHTDTARLMQVVVSMLAGVVTTPLRGDEQVRFHVHLAAGTLLQGVVEQSPLADATRQTQESGLRHDINRLTLQYFGGSYQVDEEAGSIRFSIPC